MRYTELNTAITEAEQFLEQAKALRHAHECEQLVPTDDPVERIRFPSLTRKLQNRITTLDRSIFRLRHS